MSSHSDAISKALTVESPVDSQEGSTTLEPIFGRLLPFCAIRYNTEHPDVHPAHLIAPPGEGGTLQPEARPAQQPFHSQHLFPPGGSKSNPARLEAHEQEKLRSTLSRWWEQGVLTRDKTPSIYLHRLSFTTEDGSRLTRRGFFAVLGLGPTGTVRVLPHEKTLPNRLTRQIQIFEALATQPLPIFLTYSDPTDSVMQRLEDSLAEDAVLADFTDGAGSHHHLQKVGGLDIGQWLEKQFHGREVLIADGHHRFDSLRELWRRHGTNNAAALGLPVMPQAEAYIAVYLTSMDAPGFRVGAIHRMLRQLPGGYAAALTALEPYFHRIRVPLAAEAPAHRILEQLANSGDAAFGLYGKGEEGWDLIYARADVPHPTLEGLPDELKVLDVTRLHTELVHLLSQQGKVELEYEKDATKALHEARAGHNAAAIFLNPIRPDQIWAVARAGLTMPPKATYFFPKIAAGLVAIPLAGG